MRNLISCIIIALLAFGFAVNQASAARFGGGKSFGVHRSSSSFSSAGKSQNSALLGKNSNTSKWGGVLGGLLVGGLLASLFMGNGIANGILTWVILGAVVLFILGYLRSRRNPGYQTASRYQSSPHSYTMDNYPPASSAQEMSSSEVPSNFDKDAFLRQAKVTFIRLQAAYDQKNLEDLSIYTSPEVFAEVKMQIDERGNAPNKTEVIKLDAELLDVFSDSYSTMASVRFTGSIKEDEAPASDLNEIWHFRETDGSWIVEGIQQPD